MLARQYIKLRSDLLVTVRPEWPQEDARRAYGRHGKEYLELAKKELLDRRPRIYVCSGLLYLAEINLTWLFPAGNAPSSLRGGAEPSGETARNG